jgi:dihydroneopterin aldolase
METYIELKNIKMKAFHGVYEEERKNGNSYSMDVLLATSLEKAMLSDNLEDTVNYANVYSIVKEEMAIPSDYWTCCGRIWCFKKNFQN